MLSSDLSGDRSEFWRFILQDKMLKTTPISYLSVSGGQESGHSLPGSSGSGSIMFCEQEEPFLFSK